MAKIAILFAGPDRNFADGLTTPQFNQFAIARRLPNQDLIS